MNASAWALDGLDDRSVTVREARPAWALEVKAAAHAEATRPDHRLPLPPPQTPDPSQDFPAWIAWARAGEDPSARLARLRRRQGQPAVVRGALLHLAEALQAASPDFEPRIFAISAVAYLQAAAARPLLLAVARQEAASLQVRPDLPRPEASFALAALASLSWGEVFEAPAVFAAYLAEVDAVSEASDPVAERRAAARRFGWRLEALEAPVTAQAVAPAAPVTGPMAAARPAPAPDRFSGWGAAAPMARPAAPRRAGPGSWRGVEDMTEVHTGLWLVGPPGPLPGPVTAAALISACGALTLFVLGAKLGGLFGPLAVLWIASAVGLFFDRRPAWLAGIAALGFNGLYLLWAAGQPLPLWLSSGALVLAGLGAWIGAGLLLHPAVRARYGRQRFSISE